jgi:hypothetical protein
MPTLFEKVLSHGRYMRRRAHNKNLDYKDWPTEEQDDQRIKNEVNQMSNWELLEFISDRLNDDMEYNHR